MKVKELFKSDNDFKISIKEYVEYCKSHSILIIITIVIIALAHGANIFYNTLGIDTQAFIQIPSFSYNWEGIGRFGLLLERNMLYLNPFSSYYAGVLMYIFIVIACTTMFYTFYKISGKDFGFINICIPLLCFTHPIFVEQFLFKLQCAEIAFATFLTTLGVLWIFTWIKSNNYTYLIVGIACLVICFASYQAFVFIYIAMCIFGFILLNEEEKEKNNFVIILKLLISFIIAFSLYEFIIRTIFLYSDFSNSIRWGIDSKRTILYNVLVHIKNVLIGSGPHYNLGYSIGIILCMEILIYKTIKNKDSRENKILYFLAFLALFATPFFLAIIQGQRPLLRAQLALPYVETFSIMFATYYLMKDRFLKVVPVILIFCVFCAQMSITQTFYYTDMYKNDFEIDISKQIVHDLKEKGIYEQSTIIILGYLEPPFNSTCITGEIVGASSYNSNYAAYPYYVYSTANILGVWQCLGYTYYTGSTEQAEKARRVNEEEKMPIWPEEGSIKKCDDFYIIKLSEDNLPW